MTNSGTWTRHGSTIHILDAGPGNGQGTGLPESESWGLETTSGSEVQAITDAFRRGQTGVSPLTDLVFYTRHPERRGQPIRPEERQLAQEWLTIRDGNRNPNWAQARDEVPIQFAIIRSNWGVWQDSTFLRDWPKIKAAGLVRGAYLFLRFPHSKYPTPPPSPTAQAEALIRTVGDLDPGDLPPTLDVEFPGGRSETRMTTQQILAGVRQAWNVLKQHYGVAPIIYTSARVWKEDIGNLPAPDLIESPLWLARYYYPVGPAVYDPRSFAPGGKYRPPAVPTPWGDATNWWIHQYQGDAVKLPGFPTGNIAMNRFNNMHKGATGDRVRWVQRRLGILENGVFDRSTEASLRSFQQERGLDVDAEIEPRTFAHLCWSKP
jgi:lysozyme